MKHLLASALAVTLVVTGNAIAQQSKSPLGPGV